jgi:hypothetical protein
MKKRNKYAAPAAALPTNCMYSCSMPDDYVLSPLSNLPVEGDLTHRIEDGPSKCALMLHSTMIIGYYF